MRCSPARRRTSCTSRGWPNAIALVFVTATREVDPAFARIVPKVAQGGMLWFAWPKKASGVATDVTEDRLRAFVLPHGWVDVKVCAIDATWSGLKFLARRAGR